MSLREWARNGWLVDHESAASEIRDLLSVSDRDFADCQLKGLSTDARMSLAYNSALQAATAALVAAGYRAARGGQHYRVIQSLALTIGADPDIVVQLDRFRKKRNISDYERAGCVSEQEAEEMRRLAGTLREEVKKRLKAD
jgi:hypothetical protein